MRLAAAKPVLASAAQTVQRDLLPQVPVSGGGPRPAGYAVVSGFVGFQPQSHLPTCRSTRYSDSGVIGTLCFERSGAADGD